MRSRRFGICALALGLIATGACGSDDSEDASTGSAPAVGGAAVPTTAGSASSTTQAEPVDQPASMEEWEELWAEERAAVVARIQENGWGTSADGTEVTGPGGFRIDLSACPAGWSNTEGLTDTLVKIGYPSAHSGPNAEAGGIAKAADALFKYYSPKGVYKDSEGKTREVTMILRDDAYDPARAIPLVDELIDSDKVFAVQTMGSPTTLRTYDKLNQRCIPQPLPSSGHPAFGDPVNHPWTTASSISYATEAVMWGVFVEEKLEELGGKAKIGSLRINSDFGASYHSALENYLKGSEHAADIEYVSETFEPNAATMRDEMTTMAAQQPDVFIIMSTGSSCGQIINEAALNGMKEAVKYKFMSSACKATTPVGRDQAGDDPDGWWSVGGGLKDATTDTYDDDPFVQEARKFIADAGYELTPSYNLGVFYAWTLSQAIQIAGELDGGLTRSNLILALRTMDMTNPMLLPGITFNMDGNNDAFFVEGSDVAYWDVEQQTWVQDRIIDLPGQTPLCSWDQAASRCA